MPARRALPPIRWCKPACAAPASSPSCCGCAPGLGRAHAHRALTPAVIDDVQGLHEPSSVTLGFVVLQAKLQLSFRGRLQVDQHHACLGQVEPRLVDGAQALDGRADDGGRVRARPSKRHHHRAGVLCVALAKRAGAHKEHDLAGVALLPPQLLCGPGGELCDCLDQGFKLANRCAEGPGGRNLLPWRRRVLKGDAWSALQLAHRPLQHDGPVLAHGRRIQLGQLAGVCDARGAQLVFNPRANAPDIFQWRRVQERLQRIGRQPAEVADLGVLSGVAAWLALGRLGDVVGELGQGLGGADTDGAGHAAATAGCGCALPLTRRRDRPARRPAR